MNKRITKMIKQMTIIIDLNFLIVEYKLTNRFLLLLSLYFKFLQFFIQFTSKKLANLNLNLNNNNNININNINNKNNNNNINNNNNEKLNFLIKLLRKLIEFCDKFQKWIEKERGNLISHQMKFPHLLFLYEKLYLEVQRLIFSDKIFTSINKILLLSCLFFFNFIF